MCDLLDVIHKFIRSFRKGKMFTHPFVPTSKNIIYVGFKIYIIISIACVSGTDFLDDIGI